jgi:hypothetical protein
MITVCLVALSGIAAACDVVECKTPGYWKNHPEAWPVGSITIGEITYLKGDAIAIMQQPVKGDKSYTMFDALVAAKLNEANGCHPSSDIVNTIRGANRWMKIYKLGDNIKASSNAWQKEFIFYTLTYPSGEAMQEKLDIFNNGY